MWAFVLGGTALIMLIIFVAVTVINVMGWE